MIARSMVLAATMLGSHAWAEPARHGSDVALHCGADAMPAAFEVDGRTFGRELDETLDAFVGRTFHGISQPVRLIPDKDAPYRCIGSVIFMMQAVGIREIDTVLESATTGH